MPTTNNHFITTSPTITVFPAILDILRCTKCFVHFLMRLINKTIFIKHWLLRVVNIVLCYIIALLLHKSNCKAHVKQKWFLLEAPELAAAAAAQHVRNKWMKKLNHKTAELFISDNNFFRIQKLNYRYNLDVPLVLMNSFNTQMDTESYLQRIAKRNIKIFTFEQNRWVTC